MMRILPLLFILSLFSCNLLKQAGTVSLDSSADALIAQGKRLIRSKNYADAMDKFEMAWDRDFHRSSTAALYLSGLSAYYAGFEDIAKQRFELVLRDYSKSKYAPDASFHLSLLKAHAKDMDVVMQGLEELAKLEDQSSVAQIREQSTEQIQKILFEEIPLSELESRFSSVPVSLQGYWMEALGYRLIQANRREDATNIYSSYLTKGSKRTDSDFLEKLFPPDAPAPSPMRVESDMFRISMILPFYYNRASSFYDGDKIPKESVRALEFYEGFQLAIDEAESSIPKKIYLRTYDTQRDTGRTRAVLSKLDLLQPDLVIGEIYNTQSRILSDWAEEHQTPQIIPLSPTEELVLERNFTFLAHPSVKTHGAQMADYAWHTLALTHVSVFTDQSAGTRPLADGFMESFLALGGTVDTLILHPNYEYAIEQIPDLVESIPDYETGVGVYIPLMNNEESAGLIVNLIKQRNKDVVMMGSPHFRSRYNTLSRDTKEGFQLYFTTSHMHDTQSSLYIDLYNKYLELYKFPPSDNVIQGYDLGKYVLNLVKLHNPAPFALSTYLKASPKYQGIHLDYWFNFKQSNQHVNIGQYTEEGIIRVR